MPPNGWGCKCRVRALSKAQSARRGGAGKAPPTKTRPWLNKRTGQTERTGQTGRVPLGIDPGWDTNPGKVRRWVLAKMLAEKSIGAPAAALGSIPVVDEKVALKKKIGDAKASTKGGLAKSAAAFQAKVDGVVSQMVGGVQQTPFTMPLK